MILHNGNPRCATTESSFAVTRLVDPIRSGTGRRMCGRVKAAATSDRPMRAGKWFAGYRAADAYGARPKSLADNANFILPATGRYRTMNPPGA